MLYTLSDIIEQLALHVKSRLMGSRHLSIGLFDGDMASILFLYYYSKINSQYRIVADSALDVLIDSFNNGSVISTYCSGITGCVLALDKLHKNGFIDDISSELKGIDKYIEISMNSMFSRNNHDFLHGFIGLGFYWIMRYSTNKYASVKQLSYIVEFLNQTREINDGIIKWQNFMSPHNKRYNISISHGCASTIILLCQIMNIPELNQKYGNIIMNMIDGAIKYVLSNRVDINKYGCWFASTSLECENPQKSRLAWCYGDLGIAVMLYRAGSICKDNFLIELSYQILEFSTKRKNLRQNFVYDASICHGAAGIGLIFREMSKIYKSDILAETANYWRDVVLHWYVKENVGCSYRFYDVIFKQYKEKDGLLEGTAGVALYLLNELEYTNVSDYLLITGNF